MKKQPLYEALAYVIKTVKPFSWYFILMCSVAIVWGIDTSFRPYLLKIIVDVVDSSEPKNIISNVLLPSFFYVGLSFIMSTMYRFYNYFIQVQMIPKLRQSVADSTFDRLLCHSHQFYQNHLAGDIANKAGHLNYYVPEIIVILIDEFLSRGVALILSIYALSRVSVSFAFIMMSWSLIFIIVSIILTPYLQYWSDEWAEKDSRIGGHVVDTLSGILAVRLFARRLEERRLFNTKFSDVVKAEQKINRLYAWIWAIYDYSIVAVQAISLYLLVRGRVQGTVSVGDFALVLTLNLTIAGFILQLSTDFTRFTTAIGKVTQSLRLINQPIGIIDIPHAKELQIGRGEIVFDNVRFQYHGAKILFNNKSIVISGGQKVGLVGFSGSGKTTFVNLILRLFDISGGRILIDGQDINSVTQDSLRRSIAMIPQEPSLFHRSLLDNIRYGHEDATIEEVVEAAKYAHAHEFIMALPEGYRTLVGERGAKLSGGQRQRIAIARAFLKKSPILILDEATSQLDSLVEELIQDSLQHLMQEKTTLVIAHRLSTLLHMDRILVFDRGKIVEDGNHDMLLAEGKLYQALWNAQVGGFLPDKKEE